jgi:hypothetical protein
MGPSKRKREGSITSRLTVTLAPGQREILEKIAAHNGTTYAHVVRYAIKKFVSENESGQLRLDFPEATDET